MDGEGVTDTGGVALDSLAGRLRAYLDTRRDAMVADLERLVRIESGSYDKEGVDRIGRVLAEEFSRLGFAVERHPQDRTGDHLVARLAGTGRGRPLILVHLDTVWPRGTLAENPFRLEDSRALGPGVLDMKGGIVVALHALEALRDAGFRAYERLTVVMTGDEELGTPTGRPLVEAEAERADWALVMEPARDNGALVAARGMVGAVYLEVRGQSAHAAYGDRGASAIEELAHKTLALRALSDPARGVVVNVGTVEGGSARQVVPDRARASVDVRAPSAPLAEELLAAIRGIVADASVPGTRTTMRGGITRPAFERTPGTEALLALAREAGRGLGLELDAVASPAGSDGNFTAARGVPTLDGLGPEGGKAVSRDEFVVVDSLPCRAALLAGLLWRLTAAG